MRQFLPGLAIVFFSGIAAAAGITVAPETSDDGPLGSRGIQPELLSDLPIVDIQIPLPDDVESSLPRATGQPEDLDVPQSQGNLYGDLPGLETITRLEDEIELPGLDGLPIRVNRVQKPNVPQIPGFDGLPLGFGRQ